MWAGIAGSVINSGSAYEVAISVHDSVYATDFSSTVIPYDPGDPEKMALSIEQHVSETLRQFSTEHLCKFLGAGVTVALLREVSTQGSYC
jgi:alpha,alpha-trehalose phosphorylase (configuration-retaining)